MFGCVKTYMHDSRLQQAPVLVLPAERVRRSGVTGSPTTMLARARLSDDAQKKLRDLAAALRETMYDLQCGVDALDALAAGPPAPFFRRARGLSHSFWILDSSSFSLGTNCFRTCQMPHGT